MMSPRCTYIPLFIYVAVYITTNQVSANLPDSNNDLTKLQFLQNFKNANKDMSLDSLTDTVTSLGNDLADYQKRTCRFGLSSHHCALAALDNIMASNDWLNSGHSPGKRSQQINDPAIIEKYQRILEDISKKREHLAMLKSMLEEAGQEVNNKRKRTCRFNLGGQCATELASAIADQYYYLNGPSSPGRRRRRSALKSTSLQKKADNYNR